MKKGRKDYTQEPYSSVIAWANEHHFNGNLSYDLAGFRKAYSKRLQVFPSPFEGIGDVMEALHT